MSKIKGLRQKTNSGTYSELIPFGTDDILVDMFNGLNLEQELKLGGGHVSEIKEENNRTIITETYPGGYNCRTIISERDGATIIEASLILKGLDDSTGEEIEIEEMSKTITIPAEAVNNTLTIEEVLD